MAHFVGLDVSVKETAVCVVDEVGEVVLEQKVPTEADDIVTLLTSIGEAYGRIGIEAGPLSQWLVNNRAAAGLPVVCVETRHMQALLKGHKKAVLIGGGQLRARAVESRNKANIFQGARHALLSPQLLALLRAWWREGRPMGVMLRDSDLLRGRTISAFPERMNSKLLAGTGRRLVPVLH